jgi:hypothetical protein
VILEALGHRLVDDVEPVEIVGDLLFGVRDVSDETLGAHDTFWTRHRPHFGAVDRYHAPADEP